MVKKSAVAGTKGEENAHVFGRSRPNGSGTFKLHTTLNRNSISAIYRRRPASRHFTVPGPRDPYTRPAKMLDYFEFDWRKRSYQPNAL